MALASASVVVARRGALTAHIEQKVALAGELEDAALAEEGDSTEDLIQGEAAESEGESHRAAFVPPMPVASVPAEVKEVAMMPPISYTRPAFEGPPFGGVVWQQMRIPFGDQQHEKTKQTGMEVVKADPSSFRSNDSPQKSEVDTGMARRTEEEEGPDLRPTKRFSGTLVADLVDRFNKPKQPAADPEDSTAKAMGVTRRSEVGLELRPTKTFRPTRLMADLARGLDESKQLSSDAEKAAAINAAVIATNNAITATTIIAPTIIR
jgi:hypothetical protein